MPDYRHVIIQHPSDPLLAVRITSFAAALLDVKMPVVTGYQVAGLFLEHEANRTLSILFVSRRRTDAIKAHLDCEASDLDYKCQPFGTSDCKDRAADFAHLLQQWPS